MRAAAVFTQKFVAANLGLLSMARDLGLLPIERHNRNWKRWCEAFVIQLGSPVDLCQHTFSLFMLYDDSFIHFIRLHSGSFWYITNNTHWKSWYHPFYFQMLYNSHLFFLVVVGIFVLVVVLFHLGFRLFLCHRWHLRALASDPWRREDLGAFWFRFPSAPWAPKKTFFLRRFERSGFFCWGIFRENSWMVKKNQMKRR